MQPVALFGAFPAEPTPLRLGGSETSWQRWSRWVSLSRAEFPDAATSEARVWRFIAGPGIFDDTPTAGVWRLSRTATGHRLPLALIAHGRVPAAGDPWFDAAANLLGRAIDGAGPAEAVARRIGSLPPFSAVTPPAGTATFWIDDWEVHELRFADIRDLADNGFARMLAPRPVTEEG